MGTSISESRYAIANKDSTDVPSLNLSPQSVGLKSSVVSESQQERETTKSLHDFPYRDFFLDKIKIDSMKRSEWLTDVHINAAMALMINQFPAVGGFFDTVLASKGAFPKAVGPKWLQVIFDGVNHWVLAAYGFNCLPVNTVALFDSLRTNGAKPSSFVIACIASLLKTPSPSFQLQVMSCQQQQNESDCGGFALAFATALLFDFDPSRLVFNSKKLIDHLKQCFLSKKLSPFPTTALRCSIRREELICNIEVSCSCRRPNRLFNKNEPQPDEHMVQCDKCNVWFHRICENIDEQVFEDDELEWSCLKCTDN